jgi:hypothetical protein
VLVGKGRLSYIAEVAANLRTNAIHPEKQCPCGSGSSFERCHGRDFGAPPVPDEIVESVRFVCFETHLEDFRLATNGGTAFVVRYKGTPFALTCRHVLNGFNIDDLVITDSRFRRKAAGIKGLYYLKNDVEESDLDDICLITFHKHEDDFFDHAYDLDRLLAISSEPANRLIVTGFLKQKSSISPPNIFAGLCFLQFTDAGVAEFDHGLRRGLATYNSPDFHSISGISGAPVYNSNRRALCGMVARGGLKSDGVCIVYFIDIVAIIRFIEAVASNSNKVSYTIDRSII